jgi:hypothetical protein
MVRTVPYHFYKEVDGMEVYKELLGDKYTIEFREDEKSVNILFYFDYNGDLIIANVYKNRTNYQSYRYIKKYAENETLIKAMMKLRT